MPAFTDPKLRNMVRSFNKSVLNPAMLTLAGRRLWYASVIEHHGRMSGRRYLTPVVAIKVSDGIIVPLPYGTGVDWLRNVLTEGRARITVHGRAYDVTEPEVIDAATAEPQLSAPHRFVYHRSHVDEYVKFVLAQ